MEEAKVEGLLDELDKVDAEIEDRRRGIRKLVIFGVVLAVSFGVQAIPGGIGYVLSWMLGSLGVWSLGLIRPIRHLRELERERETLLLPIGVEVEGEAP